jgi:hypothetical protein
MAIIYYHNKESRGLSKENLKKDLKEYAKKDSLVKKEKYKNVMKIDLYWKFYSFVNKPNIRNYYVLIDTPGPNNSDEFGEQHFRITQNIILGHASKVIYLLDYKQIDANLEVRKNNLWGWIEKRKNMDKDFEVLFVINKIDEALIDNSKIPEVNSFTSRAEYNENIKKYWNFHEKKAMEKIRKIALKVGFTYPPVIAVSSEYMKLNRMQNELSWDDEDKLDAFKKKFKTIFNDDWEQEFHEYIGSHINIFNFSKNKERSA